MAKLTYTTLVEADKKVISNGCGGKGSTVPVPDFLFKASCDQHDFYYWRGGEEKDREAADEAFYKYMKIDSAEQSKGFLQSAISLSWAYVYYKAVRYFGKPYFNYGPMKTEADLATLTS